MPDERWRDASVLLRPGTPEWPGDTPFDCRWTWQMSQGASVNVSATSGSPHVGTHADAPLHVRDGGAASHQLPIEAFIGPAWVSDVRDVGGEIELEALRLPDEGTIERLLLRGGTTIAEGTFPASWPSLSSACIAALLRRGLRLLGVDSPSVDDRESKDLRNHHLLFDGGAYVLENLDLRDIEAGPWELVAPPLRLEGLDAAPVRAVLRPRAR
ncbi:MAG: cyclase family protein [Cytophagaceae bacterium]|nr:cyclase family protein [Gemmatimonadaceae bacterium]